MITFGSVCSGIEAASVAWEPLGWKAAWFAEIEAFPSYVLAHHYPQTPNLGDMTQIAALVRHRLVAAPDVLVGGTPCQAFSVAGVRGGLSDPRGQLTLAYADLANAIDEQRPGDECVIYWENVPGVLSTDDNAFGCFLGLLAGEDSELTPEPMPAPGKNSKYWKWSKDDAKHTCRWPNVGCVYGPQRAIAWRVLDAQYFGVAQRRRRVFVVASARKGFDPAKLLFESDGVRRDIAPSRETGQDFTHDLAPCLTSGGRGVERTGDTRWQDPVIAARLVSFGEYVDDGTASTCKARDYKDATGLVAYSVSLRGREGGVTAELGGEIAGCLRASGGGGDKAHVLAFSCKDYGADALTDLSPTMRAMNHSASHANAGGQLVVCVTGDITHTLKAEGFDASEDGTGRGQPIVSIAQQLFQRWAVRRLTPRECERLQGFPDDYTLVPVKGKPAADGPRYKALGNSMAVPCMHWLGMRLMVTYPEFFMLRLAA